MTDAKKPKKSLGQHFLTSTRIARTILDSASIKQSDVVVEVGPGTGILTRTLLERARKVIGIEKDNRLIPLLAEQFKDEIQNKKLILVHDDVLTCDLSRYAPRTGQYIVVANLPYYITGAFLTQMMSARVQPQRAVLLLQKEVVERIAKSKKESILSLSVKAYGKPRYKGTVHRRYFKPQPKVDSAILRIEDISQDFFDTVSETSFFEVVKQGFSHKRKQVMNNLAVFAPQEQLRALFDELSLAYTVRAEDIPLATWKNLARSLREHER